MHSSKTSEPPSWNFTPADEPLEWKLHVYVEGGLKPIVTYTAEKEETLRMLGSDLVGNGFFWVNETCYPLHRISHMSIEPPPLARKNESAD